MPSPFTTTISTIVANAKNDSANEDFTYARANIREVISNGSDAISRMAQIEKFVAEKESLSWLPYEIYATEEEADGFRLAWDGDSYEYSKCYWRDKQGNGNVYVDEIQTLLDNLFDVNFKAIKERVEEAALDSVAAKYYGEEQYFLVLDDFYKNVNKNLQKKVHDKNIEKIIRKVLEI